MTRVMSAELQRKLDEYNYLLYTMFPTRPTRCRKINEQITSDLYTREHTIDEALDKAIKELTEMLDNWQANITNDKRWWQFWR